MLGVTHSLSKHQHFTLTDLAKQALSLLAGLCQYESDILMCALSPTKYAISVSKS